MPALAPRKVSNSVNALNLAACASFVPIGVVTVFLGPMLPTLSARWSLNYSQAGSLFTVQYLFSTLAVMLSGVLYGRFGFRFPIKAGLVVMAIGVALLLAGSRFWGMVCIAAYGAGLGIAVPAANLLVAEVNPQRRSAALSVLNFCWSVGAVSCPFLVAAAARSGRIQLMLGILAGFSLTVAIGIAAIRNVTEPNGRSSAGTAGFMNIEWRHRAFIAMAVLFFVYVGTENSFGGWVASYAKSLGSMSLTLALVTPSFFYGALTLGRILAPFVLRTVDELRLAKLGLVVTCVGMTGLVLSQALPGVAISAILAGFGLSSVYPITISLLSREFGAAASRVGAVMFTAANLGGAILPWIVGISSTQFGTLKAGLAVPLLGSIMMYALYLREWKALPAQLHQETIA